MKRLIMILAVALFATVTFGQHIVSGDYDFGLKLSFDERTKKITGYFENYTGRDEETNNPKFSCIFYIEGTVKGQAFSIKTFSPIDKSAGTIEGTMEIVNDRTIKIKLSNEHGGCWNVQHFTDEPVKFDLEKEFNWIQIKYVDKAKTYFYREKAESKKLKSYLINGDIVCIEKIENEWAFCTYFGKKATKGWMKLADLNR